MALNVGFQFYIVYCNFPYHQTYSAGLTAHLQPILCTRLCVLCDSDASDVSVTNVNCSPRWIVYPRTSYKEGSHYSQLTTLRQCLDYCLSHTSCAAVQWSTASGCWLHHRRETHRVYSYLTLYEMVRQCDTTSGE